MKLKTMNLTDKLYQEFVIDKIKQTEWEKSNSGPLVIELDPTAVCDLACPGCISEDLVSIGNSFSRDKLMEMGRDFIDCGVKAVILIGGGEPLAHPQTGKLISLLGENDIHIGITTNGSFIHRFLEPIAEFSNWTRVSMDAGSNNVFSILRPTKSGKSKFSKIVNNMIALAKIKKGKLGFSFLIQTEADGPGVKSNIHDIYNAAVLAKDIGCDYYELKPTYQFRDDAVHKLMKHDPKLMEEAKIQIARLDELATDDFKILKAINLEYSLEGINVKQPKSYNKCPSTHLRTTIAPSGSFICPYWRGKEKYNIGDLNKMSFKEMWNGEKRKKVMDKTNISVDCNEIHCLRHETNRTVIDIKEKLDRGKEINLVDEFDRFI